MPPPEPAYEVLGSGPVEGGWLLQVHIPEGSPLFTGHFPGRPIVPGIFHLALVARALADWRGAEVDILGVSALRLRSPVGPGETLEVRVRETSGDVKGGEGIQGFELRRPGSGPVSNGTVRTARREPGGRR
ncbi:MAG TPA: hypothetical protein VOA87_16730 [Thermoanaerobaculia bacterium]|nr:hypothetical protein [Thermoanaerobaculia bacterium]